MKRYRVEFSPEAIRHADRIQDWWAANRPKAPAIFRRELAVAIRHLSQNPQSARSYDAQISGSRRPPAAEDAAARLLRHRRGCRLRPNLRCLARVARHRSDLTILFLPHGQSPRAPSPDPATTAAPSPVSGAFLASKGGSFSPSAEVIVQVGEKAEKLAGFVAARGKLVALYPLYAGT